MKCEYSGQLEVTSKKVDGNYWHDVKMPEGFYLEISNGQLEKIKHDNKKHLRENPELTKVTTRIHIETVVQ